MARIPAREWSAAARTRDAGAICARLGIAPHQVRDAWYALLPFAMIETDDGPLLAGVDEPELPMTEPSNHGFLNAVGQFAAALIEEPFDPIDTHDQFDGPSDRATVLTLAPDGSAGILRDRHRNALYVPDRPTEEHISIFTDGCAFFRSWVAARVRWMQAARAARRDYLIEMPERRDGCIPGALLIGDARKVHWPQDRHFICSDEETARAVNFGIRRSARLSRVSVAATTSRKAA